MWRLIFLIVILQLSACDSRQTEKAVSNKAIGQNQNSVTQVPTDQSNAEKEIKTKKPKSQQKSASITAKRQTQSSRKQQASFFYEDYADFDPEDEDDREQIAYLEQLKNAKDPVRRIDAIEALNDSDEVRNLQYLQAALDDSESSVRLAALDKLAGIELYGAVSSIIYALDDTDTKVVLAAINAVEDTADESLILKLTPLLEHPDNKIRERVEEVIEYLY